MIQRQERSNIGGKDKFCLSLNTKLILEGEYLTLKSSLLNPDFAIAKSARRAD